MVQPTAALVGQAVLGNFEYTTQLYNRDLLAHIQQVDSKMRYF